MTRETSSGRPRRRSCESSRLAAYERWLEETRGLRFDSYESLWSVVGRGARGVLGVDLGVLRRPRVEAVRRGAARPGDARGALVPRSGAELRGARLRREGRGRASRSSTPPSCRPLGRRPGPSSPRVPRRPPKGSGRSASARGDRVVAYLPNIEEAVVAFLAAASVGAIWSSCSPDFGARAVADRFSQIDPKVLLAVDGYRYGGREFDRAAQVADIRNALPSLEHTVSIPYLPGASGPRRRRSRGTTCWPAPTAPASRFAQLPFDHPLWVLHSSGTTGLPKPIVHGQGGILLEYLKMAHLHFDLRRGRPALLVHDDGLDDVEPARSAGSSPRRRSSSTTEARRTPTSACSGTSPPRPEVTCFGTSAAFISSCMKAGIEPAQGPRPLADQEPRVDRLAALARRVPLGVRPRRARHVALLDERRHRRGHGLRRRRPDAPRLRGRAPGARARREGRGLRRGGTFGRRPRSASSS